MFAFRCPRKKKSHGISLGIRGGHENAARQVMRRSPNFYFKHWMTELLVYRMLWQRRAVPYLVSGRNSFYALLLAHFYQCLLQITSRYFFFMLAIFLSGNSVFLIPFPSVQLLFFLDFFFYENPFSKFRTWKKNCSFHYPTFAKMKKNSLSGTWHGKVNSFCGNLQKR